MEARDDDAVFFRIEQGQGKALVPTSVLERVESDQADPLERPPAVDLQAARPPGQIDDFGLDLDNPSEMGLEDALEALAILAPGDTVEPALERSDPPPQEGQTHDAGGQHDEQDGGQRRRVGHAAESSRAGCYPLPSADRRRFRYGGANVPMAKRARGTSRPGQRRPIQRTTRPAAGTPVVPPEGLSAAEVAHAAELEATLVASDRAAQAAVGRRAERARATEAGLAAPRRPAGSGRLAVEAAEEYQYVARDVRRIALIGGSMFGILAVLYVLLEVVGVGRS